GAASPGPWAAAIAAWYEAMASAMRAARSCARASWSRSAAGCVRERGSVGPVSSVAVMAISPRNGVVGEVVQPPGHVLREQVIQRQHVADDAQRIAGVRDPFRQERPEP